MEQETEALTIEEQQRLSMWKLRYRLEADGFTPYQAGTIAFFTWLWATARYQP